MNITALKVHGYKNKITKVVLNGLVIYGIVMASCGNMSTLAKEKSIHQKLKDNTSSKEYYYKGINYAKAGYTIHAEQYLAAAIKKGYPERKVLPILLYVCLAGSRLRTALNYTEPYLKKNPKEWMMRYLSASILYALKRTKNAYKELKQVVRHKPTYAPAYYLLAVISRDTYNDYTNAKKYFKYYINYCPKGANAQEVDDWLRQNSTK